VGPLQQWLDMVVVRMSVRFKSVLNFTLILVSLFEYCGDSDQLEELVL